MLTMPDLNSAGSMLTDNRILPILDVKELNRQ